MQLLYIAHDRRVAHAAAQALRNIAPNVTVTWAQGSGDALTWIQDNRDALAIFVDAGTESEGLVVRERVRSLGLTIPVAVIAPEQLQAVVHALKASIDALVDRERKKSAVLEGQLKEVDDWRYQTQRRLAGRQAEHDAALARTDRICTALQERLLELEAALHAADEQRHSAETAASEQLARRETELGAAIAEAVTARAALEHRLAEAEDAHQRAQQHAAAELAKAVERHGAIETRLAGEQTARATLEETWLPRKSPARTRIGRTRRRWHR